MMGENSIVLGYENMNVEGIMQQKKANNEPLHQGLAIKEQEDVRGTISLK